MSESDDENNKCLEQTECELKTRSQSSVVCKNLWYSKQISSNFKKFDLCYY